MNQRILRPGPLAASFQQTRFSTDPVFNRPGFQQTRFSTDIEKAENGERGGQALKVNNLYKLAVVLSSGWPCVGAYAQSATGPEAQETTAAPVEAGSADIPTSS
ncbi:hypothetical protein [Hoeflea sp.]|uniref:hypothetical protein n=1 Tax=Hoeflea sp. TaxID=1940281 RepID=UPI0019BAF03F|nr:hypothetical protein [Hoeflea sp.]MBC7285268.1 hypothetical protein [Hoeflea sp.]